MGANGTMRVSYSHSLSRLLFFFAAASCPLVLCSHVEAQEITVNGGNPVLSVSTGTPLGGPTPVVDISTNLSYRRQGVISKITVQTVCPGQKFTLKVLALSVTGGTAQPEVTLTNLMPPTDFIRDIPSTGVRNRSCTLQYTASSTFAQGNSVELGNDTHTVTYTLVAQ